MPRKFSNGSKSSEGDVIFFKTAISVDCHIGGGGLPHHLYTLCRAVSLRVHLARQGRDQRGKDAPLETRASAVHAALAGVLPRWRSMARTKPVCRERVFLGLVRSDAKIRQSILKSRKSGGVQVLLVQAALVIAKTCVSGAFDEFRSKELLPAKEL